MNASTRMNQRRSRALNSECNVSKQTNLLNLGEVKSCVERLGRFALARICFRTNNTYSIKIFQQTQQRLLSTKSLVFHGMSCFCLGVCCVILNIAEASRSRIKAKRIPSRLKRLGHWMDMEPQQPIKPLL